MRRHAKELIKELERLGYEFDRVNSKSMHIYVRAGSPDQTVSPGCDDNTARQILRSVKRQLGCADEASKRKPEQIKARQAAERERAAAEVARLDSERAAILAGRQIATLSREEAALIEAIEAEQREWRALMTATPASADHRGKGRARHRSGGA